MLELRFCKFPGFQTVFLRKPEEYTIRKELHSYEYVSLRQLLKIDEQSYVHSEVPD